MTELYRFFNSTNDEVRKYDHQDFAEFFTNFLATGFFEGLSVSPSNDMTVRVSEGSAFMEGHEYRNTATLNLTHATAHSSMDRIDRVVIRLDRSPDIDRPIRAMVRSGQPSSSPVAPELIRNNTVYEISLARVRIIAGKSFIESNEITDERGNPDVCGRVDFPSRIMGQIDSVDIKPASATANLYPDGYSRFYIGGGNEFFQSWLDSVKSSLGDNAVNYGRSNSQLRAYVETTGNKTNTGVQTITIFDWAVSPQQYRIYGKFTRASNASTAGSSWGRWQEEVLVAERGSNNNGTYTRYTDGTLICEFTDPTTIQVNQGTTIFHNERSFTFPASFISTPRITTNSNRVNGVQWSNTRTLSSTQAEIYIISTIDSAVGYLSYVARGRWR